VSLSSLFSVGLEWVPLSLLTKKNPDRHPTVQKPPDDYGLHSKKTKNTHGCEKYMDSIRVIP